MVCHVDSCRSYLSGVPQKRAPPGKESSNVKEADRDGTGGRRRRNSDRASAGGAGAAAGDEGNTVAKQNLPARAGGVRGAPGDHAVLGERERATPGLKFRLIA